MKNVLWLSLVVLAGCGVQDAFVEDVDAEDFEAVADSPLLGANGKDAAERGCNVVLRSLERGNVNCSNGVCWWTWTGLLDVSTQAETEGARPRVLFKNLDASRWSSVSATKVAGAAAGYSRYRFRLTRDTLRDGMSATAYGRATVSVIPYLLTTTGARLFDHNRVPGDFDTYVLNAAGGWRVGEDASACGSDVVVPRTLDFQWGFRTVQRGALVAGQPVTLTYALDRLPTCRGTHNGFPAWDITAFVKANPSGEVVQGSVRGFSSPSGVPSNANAVSAPLEVKLPAGTTSIEVWFKNWSGAGMSCETWDSNHGENYRFNVSATAPARPEWVGNPGSSLNRTCSRTAGAPDVISLDSYLWQRACAFVELDVYVPGVTEPSLVFAQAELKLDGAPLAAQDLQFIGQFGNDLRYRFEVPKSALYYGPKWQTLEYTPRFSTDGKAWKRDVTRKVVRDVTFCNTAWAGGC